MPIRCDEYNQICVASVEGDLSADQSEALRKAVETQTRGKQIADFVVDLEHCGFIDSEGLETLLWLKRRAEEMFGQVKLTGLSEDCRKILEITRLEPRFECPSDLTAALKTMR
jgi:anti-sigma B factor antagonist